MLPELLLSLLLFVLLLAVLLLLVLLLLLLLLLSVCLAAHDVGEVLAEPQVLQDVQVVCFDRLAAGKRGSPESIAC